jgi:hypothetical protein
MKVAKCQSDVIGYEKKIDGRWENLSRREEAWIPM